jgi:tol-pal system protein YbgF
MLARIDSLMTQQTANSDKLRNDMSYTTDELQRQIATLLENYNDMMAQINQIASGDRVKHVVRSSPGSSQNTSQTTTNTGPSQPSIDCQKAYDDAFILVRQGEYEKSINEFKKYLVECDNHPSAENARYWMGECYYSLGKFPDAIEQFQMLLDKYKGSTNSGRALYKLGRCNQELGRKEDAKKIYQQVIDGYPSTLEAEQSKERLKDIG